jgi:uncharacterized membrane protein
LPSPPPDSRFLALRFAGQDATDFSMTDATVRRFVEMRDAGAGEAEIAAGLGVPADVAAALVKADEAQALAHRIAAGDEPMYPPPDPADRVVDTRAGSAWVPIAALMIVLVGVIVYALVR